MSLPNFLCVAAQKAGTSSLHQVFQQHPDIFVPVDNKEAYIFDLKKNYSLGQVYYVLSSFSAHRYEKAVGEITPSYMFVERVPGRINKILGNDVLLIFCLRNPVDRAYTHYLMNYSWVWECESFHTAIEMETERSRKNIPLEKRFSYIRRGLYADQIERYLKYFSIENMFFIIFETDFLQKREILVSQLFSFLGADYQAVDLHVHINKTSIPTFYRIERTREIKIPQNGNLIKLTVPESSIVISNYQRRPVIITNPSAAFMKTVDKFLKNRPKEKLDVFTKKQLTAKYFLNDIWRVEDLIERDSLVWYGFKCETKMIHEVETYAL